MDKAYLVISTHAFYAHAGLAFDEPEPGGTVSATAKPAATEANWIDLGEGNWTPSPAGTETEKWAGAPGKRQLKDVIQTKAGLTYKGKLEEMTNIIWRMILAAANLPANVNASGQYNPLSGDHIFKGWLKLQQYDQANRLVNIVDVFVAMKVSSDVAMGDTPVEVDVEAKVLLSPLNTGTLL